MLWISAHRFMSVPRVHRYISVLSILFYASDQNWNRAVWRMLHKVAAFAVFGQYAVLDSPVAFRLRSKHFGFVLFCFFPWLDGIHTACPHTASELALNWLLSTALLKQYVEIAQQYPDGWQRKKNWWFCSALEDVNAVVRHGRVTANHYKALLTGWSPWFQDETFLSWCQCSLPL